MKAATYLVYIVLWESMVIGGCAYVVFGLGYSGWWFLLALMLSASAYKPKDWIGPTPPADKGVGDG